MGPTTALSQLSIAARQLDGSQATLPANLSDYYNPQEDQKSLFAKIQEAITIVDPDFPISGRVAILSAELFKIQEDKIQKAKRLLCWHVNALTWGELVVAENTAKPQMWLLGPAAYRGKDAPTIEGIARSIMVAPARGTDPSRPRRESHFPKQISKNLFPKFIFPKDKGKDMAFFPWKN